MAPMTVTMTNGTRSPKNRASNERSSPGQPDRGRPNYDASRLTGSGLSTGSRTLRRAQRASRGRRHDLVREPDAGNPHVRFDERRLETEPRGGVRHRHRTATPSTYRHRASRRLYPPPANNPLWPRLLGKCPTADPAYPAGPEVVDPRKSACDAHCTRPERSRKWLRQPMVRQIEGQSVTA